MGSCCSCLEATFVCLGDGIMFIVESLAAAINWIVSSILSVVVFIFDILTCHYCIATTEMKQWQKRSSPFQPCCALFSPPFLSLGSTLFTTIHVTYEI
ncbi:hypothetical protein DL96DRAFT_1237029 [Flagelloscypha sp. PMI_526]|nr:hypothetical protein DL96DRAFT_1237029 [Flagelloscypha sp. PMI_526]